jgi:hypothetical protein
MALLSESSVTYSGFMRFVPEHVRGEHKSAKAYCTAVGMNVTGCHWRRDVDPLSLSRRQMLEYELETSDIASLKEFHNPALWEETDVHIFWDA